MTRKRVGKYEFENAEIMYRNFAGREGLYNAEGERSFNLIIPEEVVEQMMNEGWNIKIQPPREEGDSPRHHISVKVKMDGLYPPTVCMITGDNIVDLNEDTVGLLDGVDISNVDVTIRPFTWEDRRTKEINVTAYLEEIYVTVKEKRFAKKYDGLRRVTITAEPEEMFRLGNDDN